MDACLLKQTCFSVSFYSFSSPSFLNADPSVSPFIHLSIGLSVCPSVHQSVGCTFFLTAEIELKEHRNNRKIERWIPNCKYPANNLLTTCKQSATNLQSNLVNLCLNSSLHIVIKICFFHLA